jgi:hypothetical protein
MHSLAATSPEDGGAQEPIGIGIGVDHDAHQPLRRLTFLYCVRHPIHPYSPSPSVEPSGDFLDQVEGIVFKITAEELATSDEYGDTDYGRAMAHASSPTGTPGFTSNPKATAVATRAAPR